MQMAILYLYACMYASVAFSLGIMFLLIFGTDLTIHKLFATRADLHRTVYTHAKVKVCGLYTCLLQLCLDDYLI